MEMEWFFKLLFSNFNQISIVGFSVAIVVVLWRWASKMQAKHEKRVDELLKNAKDEREFFVKQIIASTRQFSDFVYVLGKFAKTLTNSQALHAKIDNDLDEVLKMQKERTEEIEKNTDTKSD